MTVDLITTVEQMEALQSEWDHAFAQSRGASVFNDFTYIRTAWRHFSRPSDRLFVIVLRRGGEIAAIAPWFMTNGGEAPSGNRVIRSIGLLEGDTPDILVADDPAVVWGEILRFLRNRWRAWDMLRLDELAEGSPAFDYRFPGLGRFLCQSKPIHDSYFVSLRGSWESYLQGRDKDIRKSCKRRLRRLSESVGQAEYLLFGHPEGMQQAFKRYVALEQTSWKRDAGIGVSRSPSSLNFYGELLPGLARRGMAEICLLQADGIDLAAAICFKTGQKVFVREITFHPDYAFYSPGTMLMTHLIQSYFGKGLLELDLMGMAETSGRQQKIEWATGKQRLVQWKVFNRWGMLVSRMQRRRGKLAHIPDRWAAQSMQSS